MTERPTLTEPVECSKFWANRRGEAVIISLREFKSVLIVDVRKHFSASDGTLRPMRQGIALSIRKLPELAAALAKAERKAVELGLLADEERGDG
jgi:hypothetical protein